MKPLLDPRRGDVEDDASSPRSRSLVTIGSRMIAEISPLKLALAFLLLIVVPAALLGVAPLAITAWVEAISRGFIAPSTGIWPVLLVLGFLIAGWVIGRPFVRAAERSFWALNSLAVQPGYAVGREVLRHLAEAALGRNKDAEGRARLRAGAALGTGILMAVIAFAIVALAWPGTRWVGVVSDLRFPHRLVLPSLSNSVVLVGLYLGGAALYWGIADATMGQPRDLNGFEPRRPARRVWRVAHISDLHAVGGRYEFRIESGRSGPRGNDRMMRVFQRLEATHAEHPLDMILISGDMTDAGRSVEWAAFMDVMADHPTLTDRVLLLPGNHDLNVVDRANPARLDLPTSPGKRLREVRALSAIDAVQGHRVRVVDIATGRIGLTLSEMLAPHRDDIARFADTGTMWLSAKMGRLWTEAFPMVLPPESDEGLAVALLDSNADSHFSFTNALGVLPVEQERRLDAAMRAYPKARWIVALHHHLVEYPMVAKKLSVRIGTALINGSGFVRQMRRWESSAVVMHGHRHIDWIGQCGGLRIVSAPSPVMGAADDAPTYFRVQELMAGNGNSLHVLEPGRVEVAGRGPVPRIQADATVVR